MQFAYPGPAERRAYFEAKIPPSGKSKMGIEDWVKKTEGFSIDHCAQALVGVFAYKQTLDDVIEDLKRRMAIYGDGFRMDSEPATMAGALDDIGYSMSKAESYGYGAIANPVKGRNLFKG